jgi:hypothetical protein|tara:strand:- start:3410 stop:3745 length:336 start_codon:yes stop_codon:yes gene_type:complete
VIAWPAVIKYEGESELRFVPSATEWGSDTDLYLAAYVEGDLLIDTTGAVYRLDIKNDNRCVPQFTGGYVDKAAVTEMVKAHLAFMGQCCVAKFSIDSIADGLTGVGLTDES